MKKWKKYGKELVELLLTIVLIVVVIYFGIKFMRFFMPFVIGWLIAMIASPLVRMLERKLKIARKHTSILIIILVLAAVIGSGYFVGVKLVEQGSDLIQQAPELYNDFMKDFQEAEHNLNGVIKQLPENVQTSINDFQNALGNEIGKIVGDLSQWTVGYAGNVAKHLPNVLVAIFFTILSAYFFIADRDNILEFGRAHTPRIIQDKWRMLSENLKNVFGGYFKAQFKIMAVIWLILFVGFLFLKINFAVLIAILVAFLDMLPVFGTGTALIPWAVFKLLSGDTNIAVGLIILYLITQLVRRIIEPKMVGDSIGMNPLWTLIFMYAGYRISSVIGMILAVPIGAIIMNLYKVGVFERPIEALKEAADDLLAWIYRDSNKEK